VYRSIFRKLPLILPLLIFISWLYSFIIWYGSVLIVSIISIYFFSFLYGYLIISFFPSVQKLKKQNRIIVATGATVLVTWVYWLFWFDLTLNQTRWSNLEIPFVPIDFIKFTHTDATQCIYLFTHPQKLLDFIILTIENGYFSVFDVRPQGVGLILLWLAEWSFTGWIIFNTISDVKKSSLNENNTATLTYTRE